MKLMLNKDYFGSPVPPRVFLCNTSRTIIGELPATAVNLNCKWSQYSEASFNISRTYVDVLTGETKIHPLYDKVESPRNCLIENYGLFSIQDVEDKSGDADIKSVSLFSLEYSASNKYLTNFYINTGEVDSVEVLYNESKFGLDYSTDKDSFYTFASGEFDAFKSYYKRSYTDKDSYIYEQIQVADANEYNELLEKSNAEYAQLADKLYVKRFANVQFYNPNVPELSLLHLIFDYLPEWKIGNVDQSLWLRERKFNQDRVSIYDFLMNDISETFGCTFVWDSLNGVVHCYEEVEDDEIENEASTRWETDVFISKSNLASECNVSYSSDEIKTKLVVTGAEDLDIREINLGRNEIMDLSFYHTEDWMEQDLFERYSDYLEEIEEARTGLNSLGNKSDKYPMSYSDAVKGWVMANNKYHNIMHEIPEGDNVLLVGDEFKKLYCVYTPINTAYSNRQITSSTTFIDGPLYYDKQLTVPIVNIEDKDIFVVNGFKLQYIKSENRFQVMENLVNTSINALVSKLNMYHIDEDIEGKENDNILLKLRNSSYDVVTIRIYDPKIRVSSGSIYNAYYTYYTKTQDNKYERLLIPDQGTLDKMIKEIDGGVYTNNYRIQSTIIKASGTSEAPDIFTMSDWVNGNLTAEKMGLTAYNDTSEPIYDYTVSNIGTMGAYFVLAKDEVVVTDNGVLEISENYLNSCGVNLLKEKHKVYTSIFQSQTEKMFSQKKYQCIVQAEEPKGDYKSGTRWLDTDDANGALYEYNANTHKWVKLTGAGMTISSSDRYNYENYQRYVENYNKLQAVQKVLVKKEQEATFCLNGYKVPNRRIDFSLYKMDDDGELRYNGQTLKMDMHRAAQEYFGSKYTVNTGTLNSLYPLYTFTTSFDVFVYEKNTKSYNSIEQYYTKHATMEIYTPVEINNIDEFKSYGDKLYIQTGGHNFVVYLDGTTPCVAYEKSVGAYQTIRNYIRDKTEMSTFFTQDQWIRLSPFIKEDEFNSNHFLLTGYESEEERISICEELMEEAEKELKSICKPSLGFSMTMANILALPEFAPLVDQFQLGNFIRVEIRDGYIKRARLLEVNLNFDDLNDFNATFGNLVSVKSEIDKHAELLSMAVSAGKQVAKSGSNWQKSVEKTNKIENEINNGLQDAALKIRNANGQSVEISENGLIGRKLIDGTTDQYENEQVALINNKLVFTADNWNTSKSCFGKFEVNGQERWGVLSDAVFSGYISGSEIFGGRMEIGGDGGRFIVNEDGSVQILGPEGTTKYAAKELEDAYRFHIFLEYDGATVFLNQRDSCTLICKVYDNTVDITDKVLAQTGSSFVWSKSLDSTWQPTYVTDTGGNKIANKILITHKDVERNASFACSVSFDETKFN